MVPSLLSLCSDVVRENWYTVEFPEGMKTLVWNDWKAKNGKHCVENEHTEVIGNLVCAKDFTGSVDVCASYYERKLLRELCKCLRLNYKELYNQKGGVTTTISIPQNWTWEFSALAASYTDTSGVNARRHLRVLRDDLDESRFRFYCKFPSEGYSSPEDMMAANPEWVAEMEEQEDEIAELSASRKRARLS